MIANARDTRASAPLEGIRVVELGTLIAGPYAASLLPDMVYYDVRGPMIRPVTTSTDDSR